MSLSFIKKNLIVSLVIIIVVVVLLSLTLASFFQKPSLSNEALQPEPGVQYTTLSDQSKIQIEHDDLVGQMMKKLPFNGKNVDLTYESKKNQFTAKFKSGNRVAGEQELNDFLKQNKIESTEWLYNFTTEDQ